MVAVIFRSNLWAVKSEVNQAIQRALEICGGKAESYAKKLCPVDTGNLRNSITHAQYDDRTEAIGTNVEYAPYVELGHAKPGGGHVAAKPYLRPAVENHAAEYKKIIMTELSKVGNP